ELLVADEVRDWLALCPTGDQAAVGGQLAFVQGMVELEIQVQAPQLQSMGEQQLGVEAGRVRPMLPEVVGGELQNLNDRHACVSAPPLSLAARSAAMAAETSSSRSPAITRSS